MKTKATITLIRIILVIATLTSYALNGFAQSTDSTQVQVTTHDGNEFIGFITYEDAEKIKLQTEKFGELTIKRVDIKEISPINTKQLKLGSYWFENPQSTRYFWSPNGYGLKKGEGYYQNVWVLFNQVSIGITDNISIGAGLVPLFLFAGGSTPVWITPKISIPVQKEKLNLGIGGLFGTIIGEEGANFGLIYGMSTFGSRDKNATLGLGYGIVNGRLADRPTITFSSMIRTGPRGYFLTENYFIGADGASLVFLSAGGRRIIKRTSLDYGLFFPITTDQDVFIAIPWLGIATPFGTKAKSK